MVQVKKSNNSQTKLALFLTFIILMMVMLTMVFRREINDQLTVLNFSPSTEVASLANRSGLSDLGRFYFYTGQPLLDSTTNFNNVCQRVENVTSILGCYNNNRIYIYNISNSKLDGIREVTAAHETLHAVYARLNNGEKTRVNKLLQAEYIKIKDDKEISSRMEFYTRTEPDQLDNELHSVIGTEVANIGSELETYYSKLFSSRQKVIKLNNNYLSVFIQLNNEEEQINSQLKILSTSITNQTSNYKQDLETLNGDISTFNNRANNSWFASQYQERSSLLYRVSQMNEARANINSMVDQFNTLLSRYKPVISELKNLYNSIDSTLAPAPSI